MRRIIILTVLFCIAALNIAGLNLVDGKYSVQVEEYDYLGCKQSLTVLVENKQITNIEFKHNESKDFNYLKSISESLYNEFNMKEEIISWLEEKFVLTLDLDDCILFNAKYTSTKFHLLAKEFISIAKKGVKDYSEIELVDIYYQYKPEPDQNFYTFLMLYETKHGQLYSYEELDKNGNYRIDLVTNRKSSDDISWFINYNDINNKLNTPKRDIEEKGESSKKMKDILALNESILSIKSSIGGSN